MHGYTAFEGYRSLAAGELHEVVSRTKAQLDEGGLGMVLVLENATSKPVEIDFRGTPAEVLARLESQPVQIASTITNPVGRPKLGVVAREVTLLPRHWEWLGAQPGGASVTLRRLVDEARKATAGRDEARQAMEAADRFMRSMAGDLPGFEEAYRALYRKDRQRFDLLIGDWPVDMREHLTKLVDRIDWAAAA